MRYFLSLLASLCLLDGCAGEASRSASSIPSSGNGEPVAATESASSLGRVGSHGMVVFGTPSQAYLSHIPMFSAPHDVQLVAVGAFTSLNGSPLPESFSESLFTFLPDRISLDALRLGSLS